MNNEKSTQLRLLILDRDGVINIDSDDYIKSVDEWQPIDGSIEAIAQLSKHGFTIAIATNQSGLARGFFSQSTLDAMHKKMTDLVKAAGGEICGIFYCPHLPDANCDCRKPNTGLLEQIENHFKSKVHGAYFVGDSLKDLQAGLKKHCIPVLVRSGKGTLTESKLDKKEWPELLIFNNLKDASDYIVQQSI